MPTAICPNCRATGHLPDDFGNQPVACPMCHTVFTPSNRPLASNTLDSAAGLGVWVDPISAQPTPAPTLPQIPAPGGSLRAGPLTPEDAAGRLEWIREETARFDTYIAQRLTKLEQTRQLLAEAESKAETRSLTREMELNRQQANLTARAADLDRREAELARANEALTEREAGIARGEAALAEREAAFAALEDRRVQLERDVADLTQLVAEFRPVVEKLELRKSEAEAIRADLAAKQSAADRKLVEVGRMELALQKRRDELDEMEETLRTELEERERELERQRVALEEELKATRRRPSLGDPTPPPRAWSEHGEAADRIS